jgi:hypothetical protein
LIFFFWSCDASPLHAPRATPDCTREKVSLTRA